MGKLEPGHHTLIQALLARGPLHEKEVQSMFNTLCENNSSGLRERGFHEYIGNINKELGFLQFEVRAGRNQYDGEVYYGVVNKVADEQAKLGTQYSLPQIAFFRALMEAILQDQSGKGQILNIEALNIRLEAQARQESQIDLNQKPLAFKQFSMAQKEKTLEDLLKNRWLCTTEDGKIGLGIRAFLELRSLFKNFEVPFCDVCNEAGIKAKLCQNEECSVRMHNYCLKRKFQHQQGSRVCPSCGMEWDCSELNFEECDAVEAKPSQITIGVSHVGKRSRRPSKILRH
uniref:Non-structural maintenance of chromosomes element 1 homolog n=1 Tax=Wollemia nobilis TaxID=56998 RepID=A0A0C9RS92_9CONI